MVSAGKVRYIGVSNWRAWQVLKGLGIANEKGYTRIQSVQPRYNLLAIEEELVPACIEEGVGIISYNPLAGGMLTGRYQPGQDVQLGSRFSLIGISNAGQLHRTRYWQEAAFDVIERYRLWCHQHGLNMATTAVRWVTQQPGIASAIIGASHPEQLNASLTAAEASELEPAALAELNQLWYSLPRRKEDR